MWRRSASTAATRDSAEAREVWRQLQQRSTRNASVYRHTLRSKQRHLRRITIMRLDSHGKKRHARRQCGARMIWSDCWKRLVAELPAADKSRTAAGDVSNEQLRCGRSTQYPRSVSTVAKREYRNCAYHTQ